MITRRDWLRTFALSAAAGVAAGPLMAQARPPLSDTSNLFAGMDPTAARSVRLPAKPGARVSMSPNDRDALEHRLRCQCGCTLDVFTCRTTDFSCQVSPAMHRDVLGLVDGGYSAQEILDSFVNVYGDRVLMAPPKVGFNILGYVLPSVALGVGAVVLALMLRRWKNRPQVAVAPSALPVDASAAELARLNAAIRDDS